MDPDTMSLESSTVPRGRLVSFTVTTQIKSTDII
jgi:hypothetical protein